MKDRKGLRNYSRLKETKEHGGQIATCDSELDLFALKDIDATIGET